MKTTVSKLTLSKYHSKAFIDNFIMKISVIFSIFGLLASFSAGAIAAEWDHNDIAGWADLPDSVCGSGQVQSPLNFNSSMDWPASSEQLVVSYPQAISAAVSNNKHGSPQLNFPSGEAFVTLDGERFNLLQVHFHSPSEETFDGIAPDLDAHLVHQNPETEQLLVIGVTFNEGEESNELLDIAIENDPTADSDTKVQVTGVPLAAFVPNAEMYTFDGSLTTPPCSEGVKWFVSQQIMSATKSEIEGLRAVAENQGLENGNARPTQPLNGRPVRTIMAQMSAPSTTSTQASAAAMISGITAAILTAAVYA